MLSTLGPSLRGKAFGGGELELHDWFVPVLFQEEHDAWMIHGLTSKDVAELRRKAAELRLGDLPSRPEHTFVGRSGELLAAERTLDPNPYLVFHGMGAKGKTTLPGGQSSSKASWIYAAGRGRSGVEKDGGETIRRPTPGLWTRSCRRPLLLREAT